MKKLVFAIGTSIVGQGLCPDSFPNRAGRYTPRSLAYFCPYCGHVWGHRSIEGSPYFEPKMRLCEKHGSGLFSDGVVDPLLEHFPRAVLEREHSLLAQHGDNLTHSLYIKLVCNWSML